jgi:hypothetical protein
MFIFNTVCFGIPIKIASYLVNSLLIIYGFAVEIFAVKKLQKIDSEDIIKYSNERLLKAEDVEKIFGGFYYQIKCLLNLLNLIFCRFQN